MPIKGLEKGDGVWGRGKEPIQQKGFSLFPKAPISTFIGNKAKKLQPERGVFMRNKISLLSLLLVGCALPLSGAEDLLQTVRLYANFYSRNSSDTLESFKICFAPEERKSVHALPSAREKSVWATDDAVIVSSRKYGNVCEVKYHTGNPQIIEQVVLKQQHGQWFVSWLYTAELRQRLQAECSGKLQQLGKALQKYGQLKNGRFPSGNDAAGWEELRQQKLIRSEADYHCPHCNKVYNYMGGKNVDSYAESPLAWCDKHFENDKLNNVLLVNGNIQAMPSPATYIPAAAVNPPAVADKVPVAAVHSPVEADKAPAAAENMAFAAKTPADWEMGPDKSWYVHFDDASAAARRENKKILLLHTGSDWCGWCKRLSKDVLSKDEFKSFVNGKFILLYFDSPSARHPMKKAQRDHVKHTERKLGISGGYPCTFILDAQGKVLGRIGGYRKLDQYLKALAVYVGSGQESAAVPAAGWVSANKRPNYQVAGKKAGVASTGSIKTVAPQHWLKGPDPAWYIHLDDAVAAAQRSGRKIYALHTGSDWCPPCKNLEKNILSKSSFKKFARENLILLFVDAPRRKPIPDDQKAYNRQLAGKLKFGNGVPSILLLDSDGNTLGRIGGRSSVANHIKAIKKALELFK